VAGVPINSQDDVSKSIADKKPGDEVELVFRRRNQEVRASAKLAEDQRLEMVPVEKLGGSLSDEQKRFRDAWLQSKATAR